MEKKVLLWAKYDSLCVCMNETLFCKHVKSSVCVTHLFGVYCNGVFLYLHVMANFVYMYIYIYMGSLLFRCFNGTFLMSAILTSCIFKILRFLSKSGRLLVCYLTRQNLPKFRQKIFCIHFWLVYYEHPQRYATRALYRTSLCCHLANMLALPEPVALCGALWWLLHHEWKRFLMVFGSTNTLLTSLLNSSLL